VAASLGKEVMAKWSRGEGRRAGCVKLSAVLPNSHGNSVRQPPANEVARGRQAVDFRRAFIANVHDTNAQ